MSGGSSYSTVSLFPEVLDNFMHGIGLYLEGPLFGVPMYDVIMILKVSDSWQCISLNTPVLIFT